MNPSWTIQRFEGRGIGLGRVVLWLAVSLAATPAFAHTPHDPVTQLVFSPAFEEDGIALVVSHHELKVTRDYGVAWRRVLAGLGGGRPYTGLAWLTGAAGNPVLAIARGADGLFLSRDRGRSVYGPIWPAQLDSVDLLAAGDANSGLLLALDSGGHAALSTDAGRSWSPTASPGESPGAAALARFIEDDGAEVVLTAVASSGGRLQVSAGGATTRLTLRAEVTAIRVVADESARRLLLGTASGEILLARLECGDAIVCEPIDLLFRLDRASPVVDLPAPESPNDPWLAGFADGTVCRIEKLNGRSAACRSVARELQADRQGVPQLYRLAPLDAASALCAGTFAGLQCARWDADSWLDLETIRPHDITDVAISPAALGGFGLGVSTFNAGGFVLVGREWARLPSGAPTDHFWSLSWPAPPCPGPVFVSNDGLYSVDAAGAWHQASPPGRDVERRTLESGVHAATTKPFGLIVVGSRTTDGCRLLLGTRYIGVWTAELTDVRSRWRWRRGAGLPVGRVTDIAIGDRLYASILGGSVFASTDAGRTWAPLHGRRAREPGLLPLGAFKGYPITATSRGGEPLLLQGTPTGLYEWSPSRDWHGPVPISGWPGYIDEVAGTDAGSDGPVLLVAVRGQGLYRAVGSDAFERVLSPQHGTRWVRFAPGFPADPRVVAAGPEAVAISFDAGRTWESVPVPRAATRGKGLRDGLLRAGLPASTSTRGSPRQEEMVEPIGIEPTTSWVRSRRSPN